MVSLLYYFGVLTLTERQTCLGKLIFTIPNPVVRQLYVERLYDILVVAVGYERLVWQEMSA